MVSRMAISCNFDSGNIELVSQKKGRIELAIRRDAGEDHYQWFHFRVTDEAPCDLVITNAKGASYEGGWPDYRACASYDREHWFRVPTRYEDGELRITHAPEHRSIWYAYFAPYDFERHQRLVGGAQMEPGVQTRELGVSLDGRPIDVIEFGEGDIPVWIIARQHPGESMAEWFVEGMLERFFDRSDALAKRLRKAARFYVVPNMNPDGSVRGHLRNNAAGANLNREWETPTMERSPEVFLVRNEMDQTGLRVCLDVHGDEALPYNFIAGPHGVEGLPEHVLRDLETYCAALERACPDFQNVHGYPKSPLGKANMTMATNHLAGRFGALAMTLEMPFKDNANAPAPEGWSPARAKRLGRSQLDAFASVLFRA